MPFITAITDQNGASGRSPQDFLCCKLPFDEVSSITML